MSVTQQHVYAAPFDAVAVRYDETFTSSKIGQAQRAAVWTELARTFRTGEHVIEIGCGTGVDACFMAERGIQVTACDSSSQMIEMLTQRTRQKGLQKRVRPLQLRAEDFALLSTDGSFDGAFSNFGALNCVEDLRQLARDLARLLKPGATALLCWMGPHCLWETAWYWARGEKEKAFRRMSRHGVTARIADGAFVWAHYPSVKTVVSTFAPEFRLRFVKGVGVTVPPTYLEPWAQRHPRWLRLCQQADSWLGRCPGVRTLGDHVLVRLQREGTPVSGG